VLFDQYNTKMQALNSALKKSLPQEELKRIQDEKLTAIAHLYQMLDWQHPFIDGQGRTDLVLLSKLLTEQGFTPAILDEPYFSSYSSLSDWKAYLIQSMQRWQEARNQTSTI
jgi:fido (protein-threonine AMPylation protein)